MSILKVDEVRSKTIKLSCDTKAGHLAPSLSCVEMLTVLFNKFLRYDKGNPEASDRDRLILSKGHGCYSYYVILNELGIIPDFELENFYTDKSSIKGCVVMNQAYMLEASTGSLGHGLPIAAGMALSFKMQNMDNRVYCIIGDGELQEGSNFEAMQFAVRFRLDNLCIIVDANKLQAMDTVDNVGISNDRMAKVLQAFVSKENFTRIDGHDCDALSEAYSAFIANASSKEPTVIFCDTIKGKGLAMIENKAQYHFRCPTEDGYVHDE